MTYYFVPASRKWGMSRIYLTYVWIAVAAGVTVMTLVGLGIMGNEDGPGFILNTLAFLSAFVMGAYCILLLFTNNMLPKKIRPQMWTNVALGLAAFLYLGGIAASLIFFGALPD
jgi:tellurite resistance protein TehA-like permease